MFKPALFLNIFNMLKWVLTCFDPFPNEPRDSSMVVARSQQELEQDLAPWLRSQKLISSDRVIENESTVVVSGNH